MKPYKSTKRDFNVFVKECKKIINLLGISEWEIVFHHETDNENRASCTTHLNAKINNLYFAVNWNYKPKVSEIKSCAQHEVIHLLLSPIINPMCSMFSYSGFIEEREHDIVHRIQRLFK